MVSKLVEASCANGDRIRTLWRRLSADLTVANNDALGPDKHALSRELAICGDEANDPWVSKVAQLMAISDPLTDEHFCQNEKKQAQQDDNNADQPGDKPACLVQPLPM